MTSEGTVLVLTQAFDPTADRVVEELTSRDVPVFRCDPGDFPHDLELTAHMDGRWLGTLRLPGRTLGLDEVRCAWYRRPTAFGLDPGLSGPERRWASAEARAGLGGVLASLPHWLNHPNAMALAEQKPVQLAVAARCGFTLPDTLVTSSPVAAREFLDAHDTVVYKPLHSSGIAEGGRYRMLYTSPVDPAQDTSAVGSTTHLFQSFVDKVCDVRVTCVDEHLFAARIDADSPAAAVDFRADYPSLRYRRVEVPDPVRARVRRLLHALELRYAAIDVALTGTGEWVFLGDVNPNGQWAWIQDAVPELDVSAALADALSAGAGP